ncbi:AMP-binding enzyme [Streptomyces canus]|uniref:AMP-binding enzyme n=1 Tax=Streptomyces canus TaxID=58343 RepID=UPI003F4D23F3
MVPHRRSGSQGRGRLLLRRRPVQGHDHSRRVQRLPARARGGAHGAPRGLPGRCDRSSAPESRRRDQAVVVKKAGDSTTEAELSAWGKEQFAGYKYPRIVEFIDALPMTSTGKILKRELS